MNLTAPCILVRRYAAPCGELLLGEYEGALCLCDWVTEKRHARIRARLQRAWAAELKEGESPLLSRTAAWLGSYFAGEIPAEELPLHPVGTPFQQKVWQELRRIPRGRTLSYGALARRLGKPGATRAVANACGANALSIIIPCHRVIGSSGSLTGYGGGLGVKQHLLDIETKPLLKLLGMLGW